MRPATRSGGGTRIESDHRRSARRAAGTRRSSLSKAEDRNRTSASTGPADMRADVKTESPAPLKQRRVDPRDDGVDPEHLSSDGGDGSWESDDLPCRKST